MPETSRDRIAYWFWCVKNNKLSEMRTGENYLVDEREDYASMYEAADLVLEMLQSDVFDLTRNIDAGDPWNEAYREVMIKVLGWKPPEDMMIEDFGIIHHVDGTTTEVPGRWVETDQGWATDFGRQVDLGPNESVQVPAPPIGKVVSYNLRNEPGTVGLAENEVKE